MDIFLVFFHQSVPPLLSHVLWAVPAKRKRCKKGQRVVGLEAELAGFLWSLPQFSGFIGYYDKLDLAHFW